MFNVNAPYECLVDFKANEDYSSVTCIRTLPISGKILTSSLKENKIKLWSNLDDLQIKCEKVFYLQVNQYVIALEVIPNNKNRF